MPEGPKFEDIPSAAGWLYVCALAYAAEHLTDGFISRTRLHKLTNDPADVVDQALAWLTSVRPGCANPLFHVVDGGIVIHDYADPKYHNPTREGVERARDQASAAGKRSAQVRKEKYGNAQPMPRAEPA